MTDDEAKKVILARRTRFIAAALSAGLASGAEACTRTDFRPEACLSFAAGAGGGGAPNPCLSIGVSGTVNSGGVGGSGGTNLGGSSGAGGSGEGGAAGETGVGGADSEGGASGEGGNGGEGGGP